MHSPKILASKWQHWDDLHHGGCAIFLGTRCPGSLAVCCTSWWGTRDVSNTTPSCTLQRAWQAQSHYTSLFDELHFPTGCHLPGKFPVGSWATSAAPEGLGCRHRLFVRNRYWNTHSPLFRFSLKAFSFRNWSQQQLTPLMDSIFWFFLDGKVLDGRQRTQLNVLLNIVYICSVLDIITNKWRWKQMAGSIWVFHTS